MRPYFRSARGVVVVVTVWLYTNIVTKQDFDFSS